MPNGQVLSQFPESFPEKAGCQINTQIRGLDGVTALDPGIWQPWLPFHKGSFEVTNTGDDAMDATVKLVTSNAPYLPFNISRITLTGTPATDDVITVAIACGAFDGGQITITYKVLAGATLDTLTTALTAAINAVLMKAAEAILTNTLDSNLAAGSFIAVGDTDLDVVDIKWQWPLPPVTVTASVVGDTDAAVAPFDDDSGFEVVDCTLTQPGVVDFDRAAMWIKSKCSSYSTGTLTAIVVAVLP